MAAIIHNRLLLWSLITFILYWIAGLVVPEPYLSSAMSLMLLIFGGVTLMRFADDAWQIVVHKRRNDSAQDGDGSHLAAYGVTLLAAGSVYIGLFGLLWVYFGQPSDWLGTAMSGFGRGLSAVGFALLFFSPDVTQRGLRLPDKFWIFAIAAMTGLVLFFAGFQTGQKEVMSGWRDTIRPRDASLPTCDPERPVWGSNQRVYHTLWSPGRDMIRIPARCFKTTREARSAGYRPPG